MNPDENADASEQGACSRCGAGAETHLCPTLATGRATQTYFSQRPTPATESEKWIKSARALAKLWAADDRRWNTQQEVESSLLAYASSLSEPPPHASEQVGSALDMLCEVEDCTEIAERRCRKHAREQGAWGALQEIKDELPSQPRLPLVVRIHEIVTKALSQRPTPATEGTWVPAHMTVEDEGYYSEGERLTHTSDCEIPPTPWPGSNPNKGVPESYGR